MTEHFPRPEGVPLAPEWFDRHVVNLTATERRTATLPTRRTVKKEWQAAWLLRAITCIDLTTLAGDDTEGRVKRLCAKARAPLRADLMEGLGLDTLKVGAVCVYPTMVAHAVKALEGSGIPVASVATGFPAGLMPLPLRLAEIRYAVEQRRRNRYRHHPRACSDRQLAGALRRDQSHARSLRPRTYEGDPGDRRP